MVLVVIIKIIVIKVVITKIVIIKIVRTRSLEQKLLLGKHYTIYCNQIKDFVYLQFGSN